MESILIPNSNAMGFGHNSPPEMPRAHKDMLTQKNSYGKNTPTESKIAMNPTWLFKLPWLPQNPGNSTEPIRATWRKEKSIDSESKYDPKINLVHVKSMPG